MEILRLYISQIKKRFVFYLLVLVHVIFNFMHRASALEQNTLSSNDVVISFSGTTQGNGYNWAATLGWLSEALNSAYKEGLKVQSESGKNVRIHMSSFAGGSSGSAVSMLLDACLSNPTLKSQLFGKQGPLNDIAGKISERNEDRYLTLEELQKLSRYVRYIAKGTDFNRFFSLTTFFRVVNAQFKSVFLK